MLEGIWAWVSFLVMCVVGNIVGRWLSRRYPPFTIDFQEIRFAKARSGDTWKVVGLDERVMRIKRNGAGWTFKVNVQSVRKAMKMDPFGSGTLREVPIEGSSFSIAALDWTPEGYRHYPLVPVKVPDKR